MQRPWQRLTSPTVRLGIWCLLIGLLLGSVLLKTGLRVPNVSTELTSLLPATEQDASSAAAASQFARSFNHRVLFLVSSSERVDARAAATELDIKLNDSKSFEQLLTYIQPERWQQIASFYYPWRYALLNSRLQGLATDKLGDQLVQQTLSRLTSPVNVLTPQQLITDPLQQLPQWFAQLANDTGNVKNDDGLLVVNNGQYHVLISGLLAGETLSPGDQTRLVNQINSSIDQIQQQFPNVSIISNGMIFYAKAGADLAQNEVSTISSGSLVGIIALLWLVFRTWSPLLLCLISVSTGIITGYIVTWLVFGEVHVITLVFGASLTGVSIDYTFHYMTNWLHQGDQWSPRTGLKHILPGISLGLITSLLGYLPMLATPFPGLQQMAIFSSAGLLAAWLTVVLAYPVLLRRAPKPQQCNRLLPLIDRFLTIWNSSSVRWRYAIALFPAFFAIIFLPRLETNDDIRQLQSRPAALVAAEEQARAIIGQLPDNRFFLVRGSSPEQLLQRNEQLAKWLNHQVDANKLQGYRAISDLLPSEQTQRCNQKKVAHIFSHQLPGLWQQLGFAAGQQAQAQFDQRNKKPLTPETWLNSPVASVYSHLWLGQINGEYFSAVIPSGIRNDWQPEQAEMLPGVEFIDKTTDTSQLFGRYRALMGWLLLGAYVMIWAVLACRYGIPGAVQVVLPPLLAVLTTLSLLALTGQPINLFHVLALIMVLGIGIDYTLFFHEAGCEQRYTFMAITLSAITTLLSFGLLTLSSTAAIAGFGQTVLIGITVCYLLSPMASKKGSRKYV